MIIVFVSEVGGVYKCTYNETLDVELRVAFEAPNEIDKLFPFKDNIKETYAHSRVVFIVYLYLIVSSPKSLRSIKYYYFLFYVSD